MGKSLRLVADRSRCSSSGIPCLEWGPPEVVQAHRLLDHSSRLCDHDPRWFVPLSFSGLLDLCATVTRAGAFPLSLWFA